MVPEQLAISTSIPFFSSVKRGEEIQAEFIRFFLRED
jgi:hypothetical protein